MKRRIVAIIFHAVLALADCVFSVMDFQAEAPLLGFMWLLFAFNETRLLARAIESEPENETIDTGEDK